MVIILQCICMCGAGLEMRIASQLHQSGHKSSTGCPQDNKVWVSTMLTKPGTTWPLHFTVLSGKCVHRNTALAHRHHVCQAQPAEVDDEDDPNRLPTFVKAPSV